MPNDAKCGLLVGVGVVVAVAVLFFQKDPPPNTPSATPPAAVRAPAAPESPHRTKLPSQPAPRLADGKG
jgi:hypothetical protein